VYHFWPNTLPKRQEEEGADAYKYHQKRLTMASENTATYNTKFARHHSFEVMAGYSANLQIIENTGVTAKGIIHDGFSWNNLNAIASKDGYNITSGYQRILRQSVFGRMNYNYRSKYYLTATIRGDGSSNFAANNKWGFFPSVAFKWNMKKEIFLKQARWIDDLNLRVSAGRTGNDAIAAYRSQLAYASTTSSYLFDGNQGASVYISRLESPDLTWEKTDSYNLALEGSFFKNRLSVNIEGYHSRTKDLLLTVATPASTGFTSKFANLGLTSNTGVELTIESRNIERKKFGWTTTFTVSHNTQMVHDIGHNSFIASVECPSGYMMYGYKAGYPLNSLWGFQNLGVIKSKEDIERNKLTKTWATQTAPSLGELKYADQNNDGVLDDNDLIYLGNSDPILHGGFQNNFHIGNFKISLYFAYSLGGKIYNYSQLYMGGSAITNQYRFMLDAWHPEKRPDSDIPRAGFDANEIVPSDYMVYDASYIRLKNASISYNFDFKKNKKQLVKGLTLTLTGDNLWLWSKYIGYDPDVSTESDGSVMRRVDIGAYPKARMVILKANIKF
jgi:TonB-linked SusC/RagA family outer membrane protein